MIRLQTVTAPPAIALALGLALAPGTPALAKDRTGFGARAEAIGGAPGAGQRAAELRECNAGSAAYRDYTWGEEQSELYRSCMAGRGQPE